MSEEQQAAIKIPRYLIATVIAIAGTVVTQAVLMGRWAERMESGQERTNERVQATNEAITDIKAKLSAGEASKYTNTQAAADKETAMKLYDIMSRRVEALESQSREVERRLWMIPPSPNKP